MKIKAFENLMKSEIKKIQKYAAARDGQPVKVSAWWTDSTDEFTGFKTIGCEIMTEDYSERLSDVFICVCLWDRRKSFISEGMERWHGHWVEPEEEAEETAEAAETKGENTMITKNEYRAMFTADRDAARETVRAWRNAVEALDRIQTADLIAEETPAHTVTLFVNEVGEDLARFVIASLINASAWDGRIYSNVAEWAKGQHSLDEEATQDAMLYSRMHKAHLNQIGQAMMKYQPTTTEEAQEATTEATEAEEKEEEQDTMTNTEKLTKENRHSLKAGDELRFSNGDEYTVDTVIDTGRSVCFTLTDKRDGKRIYSHPSSECYGAEIIRAAETEEDTDTDTNNEEENDTMIINEEEVERINTVALVEEITEAVTQTPARSAWAKGVKEYALEMLEDMAFNAEHGYLDSDSFSNRKLLMDALLNGADDWNQYSWGGSALIYDGDIAKRLCNASELKKTRNGERKPNSSEEWLDTQARALGQAARLIINQVCFPVGA